jgi:hypothetical protein
MQPKGPGGTASGAGFLSPAGPAKMPKKVFTNMVNIEKMKVTASLIWLTGR